VVADAGRVPVEVPRWYAGRVPPVTHDRSGATLARFAVLHGRMRGTAMRILILGDSYCSAAALAGAFTAMPGHEVTLRDVLDEPDWRPSSASELRIREFLGSPAQVISALDGHDVLVVQGAPVTDAVLAANPQLRLICVARGGPVNVDVGAATAAGIPVVTTPGKNAVAVAELTIACMVMLARRIPEVVRHAAAGGELFVDNYEGAHWFGHDLAGHTLGLIGFGAIGSRVAARALAFQMTVVAHDPFVAAEVIAATGCEPVSLDELLDRSDVVSLHARATADNAGLLGREQLGRMRPGSWLINTARDTLVDESALDDALASGHLAGAALDVASPSPGGTRHRLLAHPNVMLLPHIGGATIETLANGGRMAAEEIERFARGLPLRNVADRAALEVRTAS
jgi:D-3-phosphoglycerate dehydrogenase